MVAVGRSGPDATFSLIFYWAGLDLGWGVRRFHDSICMFCNPTEFRKSQHPSRGSTFWPHSSAPTAGRPLNRITTRCRCWRVISVTQYTQRRLLLLRCGYCYCCMATAVIAAVWGGRPWPTYAPIKGPSSSRRDAFCSGTGTENEHLRDTRLRGNSTCGNPWRGNRIGSCGVVVNIGVFAKEGRRGTQ